MTTTDRRHRGRAIRKARRLERERVAEYEQKADRALKVVRRIWTWMRRIARAVVAATRAAVDAFTSAFNASRDDFTLAPPSPMPKETTR